MSRRLMRLAGRKLTIIVMLLIWLVSIAHGILFISMTPLWEGYDEPFHYAYIQTLAELKQLPVYGQSPVSKEIRTSFQSAPLAFGTNLILGGRFTTYGDYWKLPRNVQIARQIALRNIPSSEKRIPDNSPDVILNYEAQHPPLYYFLAASIYLIFSSKNLLTSVFALRVFSLLIGSLTIFIAYGVAKGFYRDWRRVLCIPLLIALLPMFISTVSHVANDSLAITLFSLLVLFMMRYSDCGGTRLQAINIGIVVGLGLLTKAYFLTALPAVIVVFVAVGLKRNTRRMTIYHLGLVFALVLGISGWWYLRNYNLYGNFSGLQESTLTSTLTFLDRLSYLARIPWVKSLNIMFRQHIWSGNSSFISLSQNVYFTAYFLGGLAILGLLRNDSRVIRKRLAAGFLSAYPRNTSATEIEELANNNTLLHFLMTFYGFFMVGLLYQVMQNFILVKVPGGTGGGICSPSSFRRFCCCLMESSRSYGRGRKGSVKSF